MQTNKPIQTDYKKWVLFNQHLNDFQHLYDLHTALKQKKSSGNIIFSEAADNGHRYLIEQQQTEQTLALPDEAARQELIHFLSEHYFSHGDVEKWYSEKMQQQDRINNGLSISSDESYPLRPVDKVTPHPKERIYYAWRVFFSLVFYALLIGYLVYSFMISTATGWIAVLTLLGFSLVIWIAQRVGQGVFVGLLKGNAVPVTKAQYPDVYQIVKTQSEALGLKEVPKTFIAYGHFNAFVTKLARTKYLMLYSEVIETSLKGDLDVLKFIVGHELGHVQRKHLTQWWLFPSNFVPLLGLAHSRGCEYTCDRVGYSFSQQGALEGILILATGKEIYTKINVEQLTQDTSQQNSFWVWFSEKFLTHPHITRRIRVMKTYHERGY